ncbi:hypothetical protein [Microbispora sp. H10949]|uniref:hypothetical protein n=1 Tax=Microbispora sp. H10949 TaxID=2729111 RepID=UPI001602767A|nr:hypothetical protein [Microbispora sp. H10949]
MNVEEAERSLALIRRTQAKAVRSQAWFPAWYAAGVGLFVTGVQFVTEPGTPVVVMMVTGLLLAAGMGALIALLVRTRTMTAHRSLVRANVMTLFMLWLALGIGLCLAVAFRLDAAEVAYARTYAGLVMTAFLLVTGPFVGRWMSAMLARRIESGS